MEILQFTHSGGFENWLDSRYMLKVDSQYLLMNWGWGVQKGEESKMFLNFLTLVTGRRATVY